MTELDKIITKINSLDKQKIILIILVCAVIIYIDFAFILQAQFKGVKSVGGKILKLNKDIVALSQDLAVMQKTQATQAGKSSAQKAKTIISEHDLSSLLENISSIANKVNVRIMQIKPSRDLKDSDSKSGNAVPVLITMELLSGYHNLGKFINDIENSDVLISIDELKILANAKDPLLQNVNLTLRTYVQK